MDFIFAHYNCNKDHCNKGSAAGFILLSFWLKGNSIKKSSAVWNDYFLDIKRTICEQVCHYTLWYFHSFIFMRCIYTVHHIWVSRSFIQNNPAYGDLCCLIGIKIHKKREKRNCEKFR